MPVVHMAIQRALPFGAALAVIISLLWHCFGIGGGTAVRGAGHGVAGGRERSTLLMAGGAFLVTALAMEGSFLLQFSSAAIAALAVFVWRVSV